MKRILLGATLALATGAAFAGDNNYDDRWHITPYFSYVKPDSDKNANSDLALGLGIGRFVRENISLDLEIDTVSLDLQAGGGSLKQKVATLMGRYYFGNQQGLNPYLGLGVGALRNSKPYQYNATLNLAGGIAKNVTDNVTLKTEVRYRMENTDNVTTSENTFGDWLFNAGLSVALGEAKEQSTKTNLIDQAPQTDSDGDGVSDANDRCPRTPAGTRVDAYGCAVKAAPVDGDDDRDGVPNSRDVCPHSKPGAVVGSDGCKVKVVIELQGVHFDTDKSTLKSESISILNAAVKTLGDHGSIRVEVAGHTDSRASDAYNQSLSQRRAKVVYDYLTAHGISADRMTWRGYGESQPIATNDTAEGRARNRRTELNVK